jgi:selenocysteine lyase/cysteine desulfurase
MNGFRAKFTLAFSSLTRPGYLARRHPTKFCHIVAAAIPKSLCRFLLHLFHDVAISSRGNCHIVGHDQEMIGTAERIRASVSP